MILAALILLSIFAYGAIGGFALKDQLRAYPEVDADMTEIQKEIAQLDRALDRIEAQTATKEVA